MHKGLQPPLGQEVQQPQIQLAKQTEPEVSTEQIYSSNLALVQVKSAIYLERIWHLNHSQVLCLTRPQERGQCFL